MESIPAEEANRMAYKDMNSFYYVTATLAYFTLIIYMSIAIKDISVIFSFLSAITASSIQFYFPAVFYMLAVRKYIVEKTP